MSVSGPYILQTVNSQQATATYSFPASVAGTNVALVKASPGCVFMMDGFNASSAACYVKVYDTNQTPNVGTDVPVYRRYIASQSDLDKSFDGGLTFKFGIAVAFTKLAADTDATPLAAGDVMGFNLSYC